MMSLRLHTDTGLISDDRGRTPRRLRNSAVPRPCSGSIKGKVWPAWRNASTSRQTVVNWVHNFQERQALPVRERLADGPRSSRPRRGQRRIESLLRAGLSQDPWALGYRSTIWTARCSRSICGRSGAPGLTAERAPRLGPLGGPVETPALSAGPPRRDLAPGKEGLKRGLRARPRTVLLMLDETIITEMPPLAYGYGRRGEQVAVPVPGTHADASCTAR